jgi:spore photoproduct lyase
MNQNGYQKIAYKFKKIFVDRISCNDGITQNILDYFNQLPVEVIDDEQSFLKEAAQISLTEGKRYLWLTHQKSSYIKNCHGATNTNDTYNCCNYLVVNETTGCPIECNYCFLQGYMTNPMITVYTNYTQIQDELKFISQANPQRILRVGTGELSDSLALDPVIKLSHKLAETVGTLPNILLEFKTKTDQVDHLLEMPTRKLVISWSVNSEWIIRHVEHKSAPLEKRLAAMKKISDAGFMIGLHFDPVIYYPEWKNGYTELIQKLREVINPEQITWISMGSFRTPPSLKENIRIRFPRTPILNGEQTKGTDGKMRYIKPLRLQLYRSVYQKIREYFGETFFYFCMDSKEIWREILGTVPANSFELDYWFAKSCYKKFPGYRFPKPETEVYNREILLKENRTPNVELPEIPENVSEIAFK